MGISSLEEAPPPLVEIPAYAGMTWECAGMTWEGRNNVDPIYDPQSVPFLTAATKRQKLGLRPSIVRASSAPAISSEICAV